MSLDVNLVVERPVSVHTGNITHNLGRMAAAVRVSLKYTLYDILWHPDDHGFTRADEIADYLDTAFNVLLSEPEYFRSFNPENGWGSYETLVNFVYEYRNSCWDNPDAKIEVSR